MKKMKFKSAEHKRQHEQLQKEWEQLKQKYEPKKRLIKQSNDWSYSLTTPAGRTTSHHIPSRNDGGGSALLKQSQTYTGDKMIGVSIIHKSCLQPIFNEESAKDVASMRR